MLKVDKKTFNSIFSPERIDEERIRIPTYQEIIEDITEDKAKRWLKTLPENSTIADKFRAAYLWDGREEGDSPDVVWLFNTFKKDLERNGLLDERPKWVAQGTSRMSFLLDGKCLKVAWNRKGLLQNRSEVDLLNEYSDWSCFPKIFKVFDDGPVAYLTEFCEMVEEEEIGDILGFESDERFNLDDVAECMRAVVSWDLDYNWCADVMERFMKDESTDNDFCWKIMYREFALKFLKNLADKENHAYDTLRDFCSFVYETGERWVSLIDDTTNYENWGLAPRGYSLDGQNLKNQLVFIDLGYDEETKKMYCSPW